MPDLTLDSFKIDEEILVKLHQDDVVYRNFQALPGLYVRIKIDNIQSVKKDSILFHKRLTKFIENTRINKMYGQWNDKGRLLKY